MRPTHAAAPLRPLLYGVPVGFQTRKTMTRAALIGFMLCGGLLYAGISQAQDAGVQGERDAELAAASGGPAPSARLIPFEADKAAVDARGDDVAPVQLTPKAAAQAPRMASTQPQLVKTAQASPAW